MCENQCLDLYHMKLYIKIIILIFRKIKLPTRISYILINNYIVNVNYIPWKPNLFNMSVNNFLDFKNN